jgi:hypothetical protein
VSGPGWDVGEILSNELLGTKAYYRVVEARGDTVLVEVLDAPGLERGYRFAMTASAASGMRAANASEVAGAEGDAHRVGVRRLRTSD